MTHPSVGYEIASRPRSEADLQPDIVSFGAAISACEKAREWQKAIRIFHGIRESELQPDSWTKIIRCAYNSTLCHGQSP